MRPLTKSVKITSAEADKKKQEKKRTKQRQRQLSNTKKALLEPADEQTIRKEENKSVVKNKREERKSTRYVAYDNK